MTEAELAALVSEILDAVVDEEKSRRELADLLASLGNGKET